MLVSPQRAGARSLSRRREVLATRLTSAVFNSDSRTNVRWIRGSCHATAAEGCRPPMLTPGIQRTGCRMLGVLPLDRAGARCSQKLRGLLPPLASGAGRKLGIPELGPALAAREAVFRRGQANRRGCRRKEARGQGPARSEWINPPRMYDAELLFML